MEASEKKSFVFAELKSTEQAFVEDLELIIYDYKQPSLEADNLGVDTAFWEKVYGNIEDVHYTAYYFAEALEV